MTDILVSITCIFRSSEISISWYLMNAFFLPFFACLPSRRASVKEIFFLLLFNFYFRVPAYGEWKEPLQEAVVSSGLSNCHFCSTFPRSYCYPKVRWSIREWTLHRFPPRNSHPTTPIMSRTRRTISTQRDEATNARSVAICIFQRIANPTHAYLSSCICQREIRLGRRVVFFFFF